jgi:hypothetical protein
MAPQPIVPPVVVAEAWDLTFHRSPDDVLAYYEPWFPAAAGYRAFDAEGRRLELVAHPPVVPKRLIGAIWTDNAHESSLTIRPIEGEPSGANELAELLRGWLPRVGVRLDNAERLTLPELLERAVARAGFT